MTAIRLLAVAGLAVFVAHALRSGGDGADPLFDSWLYNGLLVAATVICAGGGLRAKGLERLGWLSIAAGMAFWTAANLYWTVALAADPDPPYPSLADAGYAAFFPAIYVGLVLLVRARSVGLARSVWLDGAIAGAGATALGAAVLFELVVAETEGPFAVVATNLVYPLGDITLLAAVVGVFVLSGRRVDRVWLLIGAGLVASALADAIYLVQSARGTYVEGTLLDALWPAALLVIAHAPWMRGSTAPRLDVEGKPFLVAPAVCGLLAIGILAYDHVEHVSGVAAGFACATLLLVLVRTALTFRDNGRLLDRNRREAVTDALTGMGNRRRLLRDLEAACLERRHSLLMIFDLDGFKHYNDSFGHPAGDALLVRLGARLREATADWATPYRLGGDEFCVLGQPRGDAESAIDAASNALSAEGEGFSVTSSFGAVFVPAEADQPSAALAAADQRLYAQKHSKQQARGRPQDVLLQALFERQPDMHDHTASVAALARTIGTRLGLTGERLELLAHAALLHDVGKIAVPDSILLKPGPLDDAEWIFIQRHTVIGQRILGASPALRQVGRIVRATHERWDGGGYPDGLRGEAIPLEARIIAACDSYSAMISDRPYRAARTPEDAMAEIRRAAGTQFDPAVAEALCAAVVEVASPA
jgi:two-component system, cell cycle response regulator